MTEPTPEPPVDVTVTAPMRRTYTPSVFADLVREDVRWTKTITGQVATDGTKVWDVTFAGTEPGPALSEVEALAVWERMESRDDADQAARADLRLKRDAVLGDDPIAQAVRAAINYLLGESS